MGWIDGENPVGTATYLSDGGTNPCGLVRRFNNGNYYALQGCGGDLWLTNGDGSFNSNCRFQVVNNAGCDRKREWVCS